MSSQTQINGAQSTTEIPQWNLPSILTFRICFLYLGLYCLAYGVLATVFVIPNFAHALFFPALTTLWPMRQIIFWVAAHVLHVAHPLVYTGSGSGDKTFDWVAAFCLLIASVAGAGIWSALDRHRANYTKLFRYFRLFICFALASEMLLYGTIKILPIQMHFPFLTRWVEPFGNFRAMDVLWNSVGASPAYETFTGCLETLGGVLLIVPQATFFGALLCLVDLTEVFILNMTYDVPVKLFSFHLILMSLFILAPEIPRVVDFLSNRVVAPSMQAHFSERRGQNRIMFVVQVAFGMYLLGTYTYLARTAWHDSRDRRAKTEFYGIWNVDQFSTDGRLTPPLLGDRARWRRIIFEDPTTANLQNMDDSFVGCDAVVDRTNKTIALTRGNDKNWRAQFTYEHPSPDELILDGDVDGHRIHMQLRLLDLSAFALGSQKFHWIAEYPSGQLAPRR